MAPTFDDFMARLTALLRERPPGTTADLTDFAVASWKGKEVVGVFLREEDSGLLDEDCDLEYAWDEWIEDLIAWMADPRFSERSELISWLSPS